MLRVGLLGALETGRFTSVFEASSSVTKLLGGPLVDASPPVLVLAGCLAVASAANVGVWALVRGGFGPEWYLAAWAANGLAQGLGWGAVSKVFLAWFPDRQTRGTMYSILSVSQNAGAVVAALAVPAWEQRYGWESALWMPALLAAAVSAALFALVRDRPSPRAADAAAASGQAAEAALRSPHEAPRRATSAPRIREGGRKVGKEGRDGEERGRDGEERGRDGTPAADVPNTKTQSAANSQSTSNPLAALMDARIWVLGVAYAFVSVVRSALSDASGQLLPAATGVSASASIGRALSALEAGGVVGALVAGPLSDVVFAGRRRPVMALATALLCVALPLVLIGHPTMDPLAAQAGVGAPGPVQAVARWLSRFAATSRLWMWLDLLVGYEARIAAAYFALGALSFIPHMLIGLDARETAPPGTAETAGGFVKAVGQLGGAAAGAPLVFFAAALSSWAFVPLAVLAPSALAALLCFLLVLLLPDPATPKPKTD